jgi:hypothetical protein
VVQVRGERELMARAGHLFEAREEFVCAATDMSTWAVEGTHAEVAGRLRSRIERGLTIRKLYSPVATAEPEDVRQLLAVAGAGVSIRICPTELPHETIIVDRRVAILAGAVVDGVRGYSVVTAPDVVASVHALYMTAWQGATELADFLPAQPPHVDAEGRTILRLLSSGQKDESAARSLGMSLRTYRRRVAELMVLLDADSRFQAGVRARALGLRF